MKIEKRIKRKREFPKGDRRPFLCVSQLKIPTIRRFVTISPDSPPYSEYFSRWTMGLARSFDSKSCVQWPCRPRGGGRILRSTGHLSWAAPWIMGFVDELNPIGPVFNSLARRLTRERRLLVGAAPVVLALPVVVKYRSLWGESSTRPPLCPPLLLSLRVPRLVAS